MDGDSFLADVDLLDQQPNDFLPLFVTELLHGLIKSRQERIQRLIELNPPLVINGTQTQALALFLQRSYLLLEFRCPLPQLSQRQQIFLIGIQQLVHLLLGAAQFGLQLLLALLRRVAVEILLAPSLQFGSNHFGPAQQVQELLPNQLVQIINPNHAAGTNRPRQVPVAVCTHAPIVLLPAPSASSATAGTAIQPIAALLTDQQPLQQAGYLGVAHGQTSVLRQALLR